VLQGDTELLIRNGETANDVFDDRDDDEADSSEKAQLLPSTTVSEVEPSVPRPLTSSHAAGVVQNRSPTYMSDSEKYEELVLRVVRPPGAALGISVAGGAGSTPYRTDDQVCTVSSLQRNPFLKVSK